MYKNLLKKLFQSATAKDSFISSTGQITSAILGAIFFALTARFLGPKEFGVFSLALASAVIIKDLLGPAIGANILRFVPAQTDRKIGYQYIKYAILILIGYYAIVSPIFIIFNRFFSFVIFNQYFFALIPLTIAMAMSFSLASFISSLLQAEKMFFHDSVFTMAQPMVRLILVSIIYSAGLLSIQSLMVLNITAYVAVSIVALNFFSPEIFAGKITSPVIHATNKFLPLMAVSVGTSTITDRMNLYITNFYSGAIQVSLLSVVGALFTPTKQIGGSMGNVLGSRFASFQTREEAYEYLQKAVALSAVMASGLITTMIFAEPLISIMYGSEFMDAVPIFQIYTIAYAFFIFQVPFSSMLLYFKGRSDVMAGVSFINLIITLVSNIILIPMYGVIGAAASLTIVIATTSVITMLLSLIVRRHAHHLLED